MYKDKFQILKTYTIPQSLKLDQELLKNINKLNVFRIKILCAGFVFVGCLMFVIDYNVSIPENKMVLHSYYLWFDTALIGIGILSYLCLMEIAFFNRKNRFQEHIIYLISVILLIWAGAVGALEYSTHGSVSTIIICVLMLATAIYLKSWQIITIYLACLVAFVLCRHWLSETSVDLFVDQIYLIPLTLFGWLLSRILYISKIENLVCQRDIINKNRQLANEINIRKKAQKSLEKIQEELEQRVLKRTKELSALNSELKNEVFEREKVQNKLDSAQKMELIGKLASGIAHDLNNVLSGIRTYPDLLLMHMKRHDPMREPLETIRKSGQKAADIVQDMLMLARRGVPAKDVVNLNAVIREYLQSPEFRRLSDAHKNINVTIELEETCSAIKGSKNHLSTAIMNILTNAFESMPGGGQIVIHTTTQILDESMEPCKVVKPGEFIRLSIKDTGIGIRKQDQIKIFEPFYTNKKMGKSGTGLGMALVWGTVKDHEGYIEIKSKINRGSTFILYFPATKENVVVYEKPVNDSLIQGKKESILVVDDLEDQLFFAKSILESSNYIVHCVLGGEKAVEYLKDNTVDLIILDMNMDPGINGLETYTEIIKTHPGQKAIITTGFSDEKLLSDAQKLGIHFHINKPYSLFKLGDAVRAAL